MVPLRRTLLAFHVQSMHAAKSVVTESSRTLISVRDAVHSSFRMKAAAVRKLRVPARTLFLWALVIIVLAMSGVLAWIVR